MQEDKKLTNAASLAMILATLALGWFKFGDVALPTMSLDRPKTSVVASEEDITARLWEDPLNAVLAGKADTDDKKHGTENLRAVIVKDKSTIGLMVVPIPGTPFPDDVETRLRIRYSVQMAMADKGYAPDDHDHLGYVKLPSYRKGEVHLSRESTANSPLNEAAAAKVDVPYEWFSSNASAAIAPPHILVLWLPEAWLGSEPLCRLAALRQMLTQTDSDKNKQVKGPFVIGPRSSDTLKAIASSTVAGHACQALLKDNLCFFSCQATAPDTLIEPNKPESANHLWADARKGIGDGLQQIFDGGPVWRYFENLIPTDDQLTDLLVKELNLRRVIPNPVAVKQGVSAPAVPPQGDSASAQPPPAGGCNDSAEEDGTVLILSEADTSYGRALPLAFKASVKSFNSGGFDFEHGRSTTPNFIKTLSNDANGKTQSGIRTARYLRGLDTQKGEQKKDNSGEKSGENSAGQLLADNMQKKVATAFGESQLDYAERLAEQLAAEMEGTTGGKKFKAVGILGGDIYDKLILLRALRPKFKEALFFTTDLDARLWQPEYLKFTHNLVVASACNVNEVNLNRPGADSPPPFRDVYQVAIFHACQVAIERAEPGCKQPPRKNYCPIPHLYEIGKHGPVELKVKGLHEAATEEEKLKEKSSKKEASRWQYCLAGICLSCIFIMVAFYLTKLVENFPPITRLNKNPVSRFVYLIPNLIICMVVHLLLFTFMFGLWLALHWCFELGVAMAWGGALISTSIWLCLLFASLRESMSQSQGNSSEAGLQFKDLLNKRTGWAGGFLCGTLLLEVLLAWGFYSLADLANSEPWSWTGGISIWPTELVRVLAITSILWMLAWAWQRFLRRYRTLVRNYRLRKTQAVSRTIFKRIMAPWPEPKGTPCMVKAEDVFQCYRHKAGHAPRRLRVVVGAALYFMFIMGISLMAGFPINTNIRGDWAHGVDFGILMTAIICWLALVFFVLDSVYLAAQLLKGLGGGQTEWPAKLLDNHKKEFGVEDTDLEGYLDVKFAGDKTQELKLLVLMPFFIQFLMLVARNDYFDDWSWPPALVAVFGCNIVLSSVAWFKLRHAAAKLKKDALSALGQKLFRAEQVAKSKPKDDLLEMRIAGLQEIKQRIEAEDRGAYARWFQDPAFMAMLLPTGLFGILSVLFRTLFVAS
jgi:hypothetical protein